MSTAPVTIADQMGVNPITFEVLRNAFENVCTQMSSIMQRSSFSPILADMLDFSNAIYDSKLQLLAQAANCPVHLAAMQFSANAVIKKFPIETLKPGDVLCVNDPYEGGTHINDITFVMPFFYEGTLVGFAVSRGHWMDFGGGAAGGQSFGTHIASEGLRLPPLKIFSEYEVNEDLLAIILNNTRTPHYVRGDLQAHMGAMKSAEVEIQRLCKRYGTELVMQTMTELIAYTERVVRRAITKIPDGVYEASDFADTDGFSDERVYVKVKLTISGSDIELDFEGSSPPVKGAINSPYANSASAALYSLQFFLAPEAPSNYGMFAPIKLKIPDHSWLNAKWPSPTIACTTLVSSKITVAIWQALAKAIPEKVTGATFGEGNWFVSSTTAPNGVTGVFSDLICGGWGGTPYSDGMSVTQDPLGNCMNMPAEIAEILFPIEYEGYDLRQDSAGAGKFRGGLGAVFKVRFLCDAELSMETSRTLEGAPGANGGLPSAVQRSVKIDSDGNLQVIGGTAPDGTWTNPLLAGHRFKYNEMFMFEAAGGGGWGDPLTRDPQRVLDDVLDEYISLEAARKLYGVVIDPDTMALNAEATKALRQAA